MYPDCCKHADDAGFLRGVIPTFDYRYIRSFFVRSGSGQVSLLQTLTLPRFMSVCREIAAATSFRDTHSPSHFPNFSSFRRSPRQNVPTKYFQPPLLFRNPWQLVLTLPAFGDIVSCSPGRRSYMSRFPFDKRPSLQRMSPTALL